MVVAFAPFSLARAESFRISSSSSRRMPLIQGVMGGRAIKRL
jgi:hypothetical protein